MINEWGPLFCTHVRKASSQQKNDVKTRILHFLKPFWIDSQPVTSRMWPFHKDVDVFHLFSHFCQAAMAAPPCFCMVLLTNSLRKNRPGKWDFILRKTRFCFIFLCSIARTDILAHLCSSPYRILTNFFSINIEFDQLFNAVVLYGWAMHVNSFRFANSPPAHPLKLAPTRTAEEERKKDPKGGKGEQRKEETKKGRKGKR